jgi:hypothetical protein
MKDKTRVIILCRKDEEILEVAWELKRIQSKLQELKELLKIKSESLREMIKDYKKLQEKFQNNALDKDIKVGKNLEFYDYPKLVFKVDGEDIFAKSADTKSFGEASSPTHKATEGKEEK